jgi:26S proteasome regulatory subunit N2
VGGFVSALSFLHKQSHADRLIVEHLKRSLEERSSGSSGRLLHDAAVVAHAYLYSGTTNDSFLRDHLDWMKKASHWYISLLLVFVSMSCLMFSD